VALRSRNVVCRKLHFSPNTIKGTESRGMRWAVHMARMGTREVQVHRKENNDLEDLGVNGKIMLTF
jgi:hypothetical protein